MKTITISGTDPTNPHSAGDICERLAQIKRDTDAMATEAGRLYMSAGSIRDVLTGQAMVGKSLRAAERSEHAANEATREAQSLVRALADALEQASALAGQAADAIEASGVNMRARFEWRPSR